MPKRPGMATRRPIELRPDRRELWVAVVLAVVAVAAATAEYGRDFGMAVLVVILGLGIHVRLFLGVWVLIQRWRGGFPKSELAVCIGLGASAVLLHWLSALPLGRVAALSLGIAFLILLARTVMARAGS